MSSAYSWRCPSCHKEPKTLSFRASNHENPIFMISNSTYLDATDSVLGSSHIVINQPDQSETIETMIQRIKSSERLIFDPNGTTSSILQGVDKGDSNNKDSEGLRDQNEKDGRKRFTFEENTTLVTVNSKDLFADFRESMKEMVEAHHELRDWEDLEELLSLYLKFNGKNTHGYILAAFMDLVLGDHDDDDDDIVVVVEDDDRAGATSCSCSPLQDSHPCTTSYNSNSSCDESLS